MQEILHANIFFFVTTIAVILVAIAVLVISWQVWRLARTLRRLAEKIEAEAGEYIEASQDVRERIFDHPLVAMFMGRRRKHSRSSKREE